MEDLTGEGEAAGAAAFDRAVRWARLKALNPWAGDCLDDDALMAALTEKERGGETTAAFREARQEASIARFQTGKDAWNAWAEAMLALKELLQAAGQWATENSGYPLYRDVGQNAESRVWLAAAEADFTALRFVTHTQAGDQIDFNGFVFPGDAGFEEAQFPCEARFGETQFFGTARFWKTRFSGVARFNEAQFFSEARFKDTEFSGWTSFGGAQFTDRAEFSKAQFSNSARFEKVQFSGIAGFEQVSFEEYTTFSNAIFAKTALFTAVHCKRAFLLSGVRFDHVPDFIQADFIQAPRLDNVTVPICPAFARHQDGDAIGRYRALRRLAIQAHDYEREQYFFKGELRASRGRTEHFWHARWWFSWGYDLIADFGRSTLRPFLIWLALISLFGLGYFAAATKPCADALSRSVYLSAQSAVLFVGGGRSAEIASAYACLYGGSIQEPVIPSIAAFLGLGHALLSAVLIFLFLLALRNMFKVK